MTAATILIWILAQIFFLPNQRNNLYDSSPFFIFGIIFGVVGVLGLVTRVFLDIRPLFNPSDRITFALFDFIFGYDKKFNKSIVGNRHIRGAPVFVFSIIYIFLGLVCIVLGILSYVNTPISILENDLLNNGLYANPLFHVFLNIFGVFVLGFIVISAITLSVKNSPNKITAIFVKLFLVFSAVVGFFIFFVRAGCYMEDARSQIMSDKIEVIQVVYNRYNKKNKIGNVEYENKNRLCKLTKIVDFPYFVARNSKGETQTFAVPLYIAEQLRKQPYIIYFYKNTDLVVRMKMVNEY